MFHDRFHRSVPNRRGSALATLVLCVLTLSTLAAGLAFVGLAQANEQRGEQQGIHSDFVCQAGLAQSMYQLNTGANGNVGSHANPAAWGGSRYWVAATNVTPDVIRLTATGIDDHSGASQELTVRAIPNTIWRYGAFGREWLHEDSNARVDSYNSSLGSYASQNVNGNGSDQHANSRGNVGSNGDVGLDQNATVWGDSIAGPSHSTTILGNARVSGSTTPASLQVTLPTINVPTYPSTGNLTVTNNQTLASGNYNYGTLQINSSKTLTINGPANVVCSSMTLRSNANVIVNATNGPVTFYVIDNFILNSNSVIRSTTYSSLDVRLNLLSDNVINPEVNIQLDQIDFMSNSQIYGTVLAPNARVTLNSNFEMFGAFMARSFDVHSNARFHFDEALLNATANGIPTYETVCWREIPYQK